jgi:hypothetical protein
MLEISPSTDELRQGDICTVPFFPRWDLEKTPSVKLGDGIQAVQMMAWDPVVKAEDGSHLAMVCSHDCDLENPRSRSGVLIAPIISIPAKVGSDAFNTIVASHSMHENAYAHFPLFPFPLPGAEGRDEKWVVADFSSAMSFGRSGPVIEALLGTKKHQLTDEARVLFRTKLGTFLGRP